MKQFLILFALFLLATLFYNLDMWLGLVLFATLALYTIYLTIFAFYNQFKARYEKIVFHKGRHRKGVLGVSFNPFYCNKKHNFGLQKRYMFTDQSEYHFDDFYGNTMTSKLFGVSQGNHMKNSVRAAWRWKLGSARTVELFLYLHINGVTKTIPVCECLTHEFIAIELMVEGNYAKMVVFRLYGEDDDAPIKIGETAFYPIVRKSFGYYLNEYFGGDYPAPSEVSFIKQQND